MALITGTSNSLSESIAILQRNFAQVVTHGQGMWWLFESIDPVREPAFAPWLRNFHELGDFLVQTDRTPSAEIAVLLDDESFFYESDRINLDLPLDFPTAALGPAANRRAF